MRLWTELDDAEKDAAIAHFSRVNAFIAPGEACSYEPTYTAFELLDRESTRRQLRKHRDTKRFNVPRSKTPDYSQMVLRVHGNAVVLGDIEIPDHDADMLESAMAIGELFGIDTLIINGDLMASDAFSGFIGVPAELDEIDACDELSIARDVILALGKHFRKVYFCEGNHDKRIRRYTDGSLTMSSILRLLLSDIKTTPFSQIELVSGNREWLVCHPKNYSKVPLSVSRDIAETKRKNVICAHTHHLDWCNTKCGELVAIDGGYCRDERRTLYKWDDVTRHPKWNPGFVVIRNGYHYLFSRDKTDWDFWFSLMLPTCQ